VKALTVLAMRRTWRTRLDELRPGQQEACPRRPGPGARHRSRAAGTASL